MPLIDFEAVVNAEIGIAPSEIGRVQSLTISVSAEIEAEAVSNACATGDIGHTLDYGLLRHIIHRFLKASGSICWKSQPSSSSSKSAPSRASSKYGSALPRGARGPMFRASALPYEMGARHRRCCPWRCRNHSFTARSRLFDRASPLNTVF